MLDPVQVPMALLDRLKDLLERVEERAIQARGLRSIAIFPMEDLKNEAHACLLEIEPLRWPRPIPPPIKAANASPVPAIWAEAVTSEEQRRLDRFAPLIDHDFEAEALKTLDLDRQ